MDRVAPHPRSVVPPPANVAARARRPSAGPPLRLTGGAIAVLAGIVGLVILHATDQVVPASSAHQAQVRIWLASRAAGFTSLGLLTVQVALGLVLSHPTNKSTWRLSRLLFPWHENAWVFVLAFLAAHVVSIVLDPYAGVGISGAIVPGLSDYRTTPVALGSLGMWALVLTGLTARYTKLLPPGVWLSLHRLSLVVFGLAWMHGLLAGTDSVALLAFYVVTGGLVIAAAAYRYWVSRQSRPTFSTSLQEEPR